MVKTVDGVVPVRIPAALASNDPAVSLSRLAEMQNNPSSSLNSVAFANTLPAYIADQSDKLVTNNALVPATNNTLEPATNNTFVPVTQNTLVPATTAQPSIMRSQNITSQSSAAVNSPANASALTKQVFYFFTTFLLI